MKVDGCGSVIPPFDWIIIIIILIMISLEKV